MKRLISILLTVVMLLSMLVAVIPASAAESTGNALKFQSGLKNVWRSDKKITALPRTFEATIDVPTTVYDNYEGQILALYSIYNEGHFIFVDLLRKDANNQNASGNLGIRLLIKDGATEATKVYYEALNNYVGQKIHVAITVDTEVKLYINGSLYSGPSFLTAAATEADFINIYNAIDYTKLPKLCLGGDDRLKSTASGATAQMKLDNSRFFTGGIYNACIFSDVRTANEIASDKNTLPTSETNLLVSYDTSEAANDIIPDKSGNGFNLKKGVFHGKSFESSFDNLYSSTKQVTVLPKTLEAYITVPESYTADQWWGTIIAWDNEMSENDYIVLDVRNPSSNQGAVSNTGVAARFLVKANGTTETVHFIGSLESYRGKQVHLAIVIGDTDNSSSTPDTVELYLDGVRFNGEVNGNKENAASLYKNVDISKLPMPSIGGDFRAATGSTEWPLTNVDNYRYFRGKIFTVCAFTDIRTSDEINSDMITLPTQGADNLLMSYDFFDETSSRVVPDKSGNGYNMSATPMWLDAADKTPITNYAYSFAVVGDTQKVTINEINPDKNYGGSFDQIYDWILANQKSKNIQFAFHMGDVTDNDKDAEWKIAMAGITQMDGKIPYNIARGNHDTGNNTIKYYTTSMYTSNVVAGEEYGFFDGRGITGYTQNTLNAYQTITVGDVMYLMLSLDMGPCAAVIEWANEVIEAHPYHNVIITTHSYLQGDYTSTTYEGVDKYPYMDAPKDCSATQYNPGEKYGQGSNQMYDFRLNSHKNAGEAYLYQDATYMLNNLVKKHSNISMVICGHECSEYIKQISATGDAGNNVLQFLVDGQDVDKALDAAGDGLAGLVAMFYFSEDGKSVTTEYYSTIRNQYLHDDKNTNTYAVNVVEVSQPVQTFYSMMHTLDSSNYTTEEWAAISTQLEATRLVVIDKNSTDDAIATAVSTLEEVVAIAEIDYSELNAAISSANALVENDYSVADWNDIQTAINNATTAISTATSQEQIDTAKTTLNSVINAKTALDRNGIEATITASANKVEGEYTAASWLAYERALEEANRILESSRDQNAINKAKEDLVKATLALTRNIISAENGTSSRLVYGFYNPGASAGVVISVDVSWGSMTFTYKDGDLEWDLDRYKNPQNEHEKKLNEIANEMKHG